MDIQDCIGFAGENPICSFATMENNFRPGEIIEF
jgi:hypothetical protein